jgi:hypothetical protein
VLLFTSLERDDAWVNHGGFPVGRISDSSWRLGMEASLHDETPFDGYP